MAKDDPPTTKQQAYLRSLAQSTGTSFTPPRNKREASAEIKRLKSLGRSATHEQRTDRDAIQSATRGGASRVRDTEITGYGSSAHWKGTAIEARRTADRGAHPAVPLEAIGHFLGAPYARSSALQGTRFAPAAPAPDGAASLTGPRLRLGFRSGFMRPWTPPNKRPTAKEAPT